MMTLNPDHRPNIDEIQSHPWMQGVYATDEEIQEEFKTRKSSIDKETQIERKNKRKQEKQRKSDKNSQNSRNTTEIDDI